MRPLIFDDSALVGLFNGVLTVSRLWFWAEREAVAVLLSAAAIAVANQQLCATDNAWTALLLADNVQVLDLTAATALGASRYDGYLAVAHTSYEAAATDATIVTGAPELYDPSLRTASF